MSHYHQLDDQQNAAAYAAQNPYHNQPQQQQQQPQPISYQPPVVYVQQQHAQPAYPPHQQQVSYQPPQYSAHPQALHAGYVPPKHGAGPADPERGGGGGVGGGGVGGAHDPRFEASNMKCRDAPWAVLFVLHAIAILVLAAVFLRKYHADLTSDRDRDDDGQGGQRAIKFNGRSAGILGVVAVGAIMLSWAWLSAFKVYARQLIWACLLASPIFQMLLAVLFFGPLHVPAAGIVCLITAALNALYIYLVRSRVPLTAQILSIVVQVLQQFPATTAVAFGAILVQIAWVICWIVAAAGAMHGLRDSETTTTHPDGTVTRNSHDGIIGLVWFFMLVSFYWTLHVVQNVCHVTTAGVVATWYFRAPDHLPQHPTAQALRRATWSSFGSVCLGSLIISVVNGLRAIVNSARNTDHPVARVIVLCLLNCLERIIEFFNIYAFTQIAIYVRRSEGLSLARPRNLHMNDMGPVTHEEG